MSELFELLNKETTKKNHQAALSICHDCKTYTVLTTDPTDIDALKVNIVALINLNKFSQAEAVASRLPDFQFQKAYILYKKGQFKDCFSICQSQTTQNFLLLKAQTVKLIQLYRMCQFQQAVQLYQQLLKQSGMPQVLINLSACMANPSLAGQITGYPGFSSGNDWQIQFNTVLGLTYLKEYPAALDLIQKIEIKLDKHDLYQEKFICQAQKGLIAYLIGDKERSMQIFSDLKESQADSNVKALVSNNLLVLSQQEGADVIKGLNQCLNQENKLSTLQKLTVLLNVAYLSGKRRKFEIYQKALREVQEIDQKSRKLINIKAFTLSKQKKHDQYRNLLQSVNQGWASLLLSRILLQFNRQQQAISVYLKAKQEHFSIRTVGFYISLASLMQKNLPQAIQVLKQGYQLLKDKSLLKSLADYLIKANRSDQAIEIIQSFPHKDTQISSLLVFVATMTNNQQLALQVAGELPEVDLRNLYSAEQVMSLDEILDSLEFANISAKKVLEEKKTLAAKPKIKKKPRYPKNFDPNNPNNPKPDPERWMPKNQRSQFLRQLKKKKVKSKATYQGAASTDAEISHAKRNPTTAHMNAQTKHKKKRRR